jgi:hypothetical protein
VLTLAEPLRHNCMPRLSQLRLSDNPSLGDDGVATLADILRPPCTHCGTPLPVNVDPWKDACQSCGRRGDRESRRSLLALTQLQSLELVGTGVGDAGASALANALGRGGNARALGYVALVSEVLGHEGAHAFACVLDDSYASTHICRLWLSGSFEETTGSGFHALTSACDRRRVHLELAHGFVWGM